MFNRLYGSRLFQVLIVTVCIVSFSTVGVYYFEKTNRDGNIHSIWDGIWWAIVTMATVGYGDKYPVSPGGRIVALLLIIFGVGLMSLFTATIASMFVEKKLKEEKGLESIKEKDHLVVCGWNHHTEEVLKGLIMHRNVQGLPVIMINELSIDDIDSLKLKYSKDKVRFLRGDFVNEDVLHRADITRASFAVLMADISGHHDKSRSDERTALAALAIKSLAPTIKIVAELLDSDNEPHLKRANVDDIVVRGKHTGYLLASAVHSPGVTRVLSNVLDPGDGNMLLSTEIPKRFIGGTFGDLFAFFRRERQAIVIGLLREKKSMKLEDLLSDNTSLIDTFIKEKIRESKKDLFREKEQKTVIINPEDSYAISQEDRAIVLSRSLGA